MKVSIAPNVKPFVERVGLELRRAERYRIFVSLIVFDLNALKSNSNSPNAVDLARLLDLVAGNTRSVDYPALIDSGKVAILLPETPRQGAEVAGRRVVELIRKKYPPTNSTNGEQYIPLEMASYPDAAGARTVQEMLGELSGSESAN